MSTKNPWRQNANLAFGGTLEQFGDEVGVKAKGYRYEQAGYHYSFIDQMRAADEAATTQRQQTQLEKEQVLRATPASQFLSSSKVSHLMALVQSLHSHYDQYNSTTFLRHLDKELHRRDANHFIHLSPENRASFHEVLTLALKLSDKGYVNQLMESQHNTETYLENSIEAAKALLHDLFILEDLVDKIASLQTDFMTHTTSSRCTSAQS